MIQFSQFRVKADNLRDCYVLIKGIKVFKIENIQGDLVSGVLSNTLEDFYTYPLASSTLGIYKFTNFSINPVIIDVTQIIAKCFVMYHHDCYFACELVF